MSNTTSNHTVDIRNGKTVLDVVREYFPECDERTCDFILWEETGYPCFWDSDDPEDSLRLQLAKLASREFLYCDHAYRNGDECERDMYEQHD